MLISVFQIIANLFFKFLSEDTLSNSEKRSPLLRKKIVFDNRDNICNLDSLPLRTILIVFNEKKYSMIRKTKMYFLSNPIQMDLNHIMTYFQEESSGLCFQ